MNLSDLLMNSMSSESSVEALSKKAGVSAGQTSSLLSLALPILLRYLTNNASSQGGALSLANALTQHTNTSTMTEQFANADADDGNHIIAHILGNDNEQVVNSLSSQTGMDTSQVSSLLGNMAPGLMSGISAAATSAQASQQETESLDFSDLMGTFGGSSSGPGGLGLLSSLTGGGSSGGSLFGSDCNGTGLLSSLLSLMK